MNMKMVKYEDIRKEMKAGDVIAFGGKGELSNIIKIATRSGVSHIGVILQSQLRDDDEDRFFNQIIESTSLDGREGVQISRMSDRIRAYDGELWWLPRDDTLPFDQKKFFNFLFAQDGKKYDLIQALKAGVDLLDRLKITRNTEDFDKLFCSELVAGGLEAAGTVGEINASEVTPIDLCRWRIYEKTYYQLESGKGLGSVKTISRYNTANPADWNV